MRVIAGTRRSMPLVTVPGDATRPTTDRIKETLFNVLQTEVPGSRFLDLFAGSGGIGIEALSRGAACCTFVDKSRRAAAVISQNLRFTKLEDVSEVLTTDAAAAIRHLETRDTFDLVFLDPPYGRKIEEEILRQLSTSPILANDALIIVEAAMETDFSYLKSLGYVTEKEKRYKSNKHLFLRRTRGE